jgi:ABC-type antimicrobial peptide transport system ATPase subunit
MDTDKVLVMADGKVAEYGTPTDLIADQVSRPGNRQASNRLTLPGDHLLFTGERGWSL